MVLCLIWFLSIALNVGWSPLKKYVTRMLLEYQLTSALNLDVDKILNQLGQRSSRCSIDGRLAPAFKILLIIVFILLIVSSVKSMIISICIDHLTPRCWRRDQTEQNSDRSHATLSFIAILFLNVFLSFPFYFVSVSTSILAQFDASKATFSKTLKVCFLVRLLSIAFQCSVFYLLDEDRCSIMKKVRNCVGGSSNSPPGDTSSGTPAATELNNGDPPLAAELQSGNPTGSATGTNTEAEARQRLIPQQTTTMNEPRGRVSTQGALTEHQNVETQHTNTIDESTIVATRTPRANDEPTTPIKDDQAASEPLISRDMRDDRSNTEVHHPALVVFIAISASPTEPLAPKTLEVDPNRGKSTSSSSSRPPRKTKMQSTEVWSRRKRWVRDINRNTNSQKLSAELTRWKVLP